MILALFKVNVEAAALLMRCNAYAAQTLLSLAAGFLNYAQFYSYRRMRPQVLPASSACVPFMLLDLLSCLKTSHQSLTACTCLQVGPAESPRLWWQHAARAVLRERRLLAAAGATCYSQARAGKRRSHRRIYSRCKGGLCWCVFGILLHVITHIATKLQKPLLQRL